MNQHKNKKLYLLILLLIILKIEYINIYNYNIHSLSKMFSSSFCSKMFTIFFFCARHYLNILFIKKIMSIL